MAQSTTPEDETIQVVNDSRDDICELWITSRSSDTGTWMVHEEHIAPGSSVRLSIADDEYRIRLVACDSTILAEETLSPPEINTIRIFPSDGCIAHEMSIFTITTLFGVLEDAEMAARLAITCFGHEGDLRGVARNYLELGRLEYRQGKFADASKSFEEAARLSSDLDDEAGLTYSLYNLATTYVELGESGKALEIYYQLLPILQELDLVSEEAIVLSQIGAILVEQDHIQEGQDVWRESLAIWDLVQDPLGKSGTLFFIADTYHRLGILDQALAAYEDTFAIRRELGEIDKLAEVHSAIGLVYLEQRNLENAQSHFLEALELHQLFDHYTESGPIYYNLGRVYQLWQRYGEAIDSYEQAVVVSEAIGDPVLALNSYSEMGVAQEALELHEDALVSYEMALSIARDINAHSEEEEALDRIAAISSLLGRTEKALTTWQQILSIKRRLEDRSGEATILNNIGVVYDAQGHLEEALRNFHLSLAISSELEDLSLKSITLANIGSVQEKQGYLADASVSYSEALSLAQRIDDKTREARALSGLGSVYFGQGRVSEALAQFDSALAIQRQINDLMGAGKTLNDMGKAYWAMGLFNDAANSATLALDSNRRAGSRVQEGESLIIIGLVYTDQGRYQEALNNLEPALGIFQSIGDRYRESGAMHNIASVYHLQGRYGEAIDYYERALVYSRESDLKGDEAITLCSLGMIYHALGRSEEALEGCKNALLVSRNVSDPSIEAMSLANIGSIYHSQGMYDEALDHYQQALTIFQEIGYGAAVGVTQNNIGAVLQSTGDYQETLNSYLEAVAVARRLGDRMSEGTALGNIGSLYQEQGDYIEASGYYDQALTIAREIGDREGENTILNNMGLILAHEGRINEALDLYEQALLIGESLRAGITTDYDRQEFSSQPESITIYDRTADLYLITQRPDKAFHTSERARARSFLDALATGYVEPDNRDLYYLLEQEQITYQSRQALREALIDAHGQDPVDEALIASLETDLAKAESAHNISVENITSRGGWLTSLIPGRGLDYVLEVGELQNLLPADTTLISYFIHTDHYNEEHTTIFVITNKSFETVDLPIGKLQLANEIRDFFGGLASTFEHHPDSLRQLYGWLIEPIAAELNTTNLIIVPHSVLHYLPFAALTDGEQYLGDRFVITTLPSASVLPLLAESKPGPVRPLVLGNPASDANLDNLPDAEDEAETIAGLYGQPAYTGQSATESLVREQAGQNSVLHIASHAEFNDVAPLQSGLYLAPDETNDGLLHVDEVYGLDLTATDLVVLSACQTSIGEVSPGDDIVALNRAFLFAGAPTVIASLWEVDDRATSILMTRFYSYLDEGWGKAEALRQAQIDLRAEHPEYAHPFFWAGFVMNGDGGKVTRPIVVNNRPGADPAISTDNLQNNPDLSDDLPVIRLSFLGLAGLSFLFLVIMWTRRYRVKGQINQRDD